jgi:hypothetical protein
MTTAEFRRICDFVLARGDRMTWCNMYSDNPHYTFEGFDVFLDPDVGQRNINCDPAKSGFDTLVIRDWETTQIYFHVRERGTALEVEAGAEPYLDRILTTMGTVT